MFGRFIQCLLGDVPLFIVEGQVDKFIADGNFKAKWVTVLSFISKITKNLQFHLTPTYKKYNLRIKDLAENWKVIQINLLNFNFLATER